MLFSIIIPTYNRAVTLVTALHSVLEQSFDDWELIIVDDGSTDNTEAIVNKLMLKHPKINYKKIIHSGHVAAKNHGIEMARGNYITFLDSDDKYKPEHLQTYADIIFNENPDFIYGNPEIIGNEFVEDFYHPGKMIHIDHCTVGGTFCIKHTVFEETDKFPNTQYGDDALLFAKIKNSGFKIVKSKFRTYIYNRTGSDSLTKNRTLKI